MEPNSAVKHFETSASHVWFDEHGIVRSVTKPNAVVDRAVLEAAFDFIIKNSGGKKICCLGVISTLSSVDKEARDFSAEKTPEFFKALGLVAASKLSLFIASVFIILKKPPYPVKIFDSEEEALKWLRTFL